MNPSIQRLWVAFMNKVVKSFHGRSVIAVALAGAATALLAGCSSDVSGVANPFQASARFGGSDRTATGSILPPEPVGQGTAGYAPTVAAAPTARVTSTPLAPVRSMPPSSYASQSLSSPMSAPVRAPVYASVRPVESAPAPHGGASVKTDHGVWSADGGTMILVHPGENAATIATRYNVPLDVLTHVNGFVSAAQVRPGARVVIPVYSASAGVRDHTAALDDRRQAPARPTLARVEATKQSASEKRQLASAEPHGRETFHFVKGPTGAPTPADVRRAVADARTAKDARLAKTDERGAKSAPHGRELAEAQIKPLPQSAIHSAALKPNAEAPVTRGVDRTSTASLPPAGAESVSAHDAFRWPVRGRIIEGFKQGSNEGINIAVPDGTNVKAADDGVVAYAGNELKGYGNLVLIRHPNGFVTAYANNGEIDVKRGETVKRGQVIAKSGASGNVSSPQLHFELRKGQTPVDPTAYLAGT
jgi:murein DD-endopeptidase MepM/ murein hydrolase activator NlpD